MINPSACVALLNDLRRHTPYNPRYTDAMIWEKIVNRKESVSFDRIAWAWCGVELDNGYNTEPDVGELSLYIKGDTFEYISNPKGSISLISYLHEGYSSEDFILGEYVSDMDKIMQFCLEQGFWIDSEFLIRITADFSYDSYFGEYDEDWDWKLMHVDNPLQDTQDMIDVMQKSYEYNIKVWG